MRHARWLAAVPARSLAFGAAMVVRDADARDGRCPARSRSSTAGDGGQDRRRCRDVTVAAIASPTTSPATVRDDRRPCHRRVGASRRQHPPSTAAPTTTTAAARRARCRRPASWPRSSRRCSRCWPRRRARRRCRRTCGPSLAAARNRALPYTKGCVNVGVNARLQPCEFGVPGAERTILLYGDSHAVQWYEPLEQIAQQRGYRLVADRQGRLPGDRRRRADTRAAPHLPAVPRRRDRLDRDEPTGAGRGLQLLQPLRARRGELGRRGGGDDRPTGRRRPAPRRHRRQPVEPSPTRRRACPATSTTPRRAPRRAPTPSARTGSAARSPPLAPTARRSSTPPTGSAPGPAAPPSSATSSCCATRRTSRHRWPSS